MGGAPAVLLLYYRRWQRRPSEGESETFLLLSPRKSKESCQEVSFGLLAASLPIGTVEGATLLSEAAQIGGRRSNRRERKKENSIYRDYTHLLTKRRGKKPPHSSLLLHPPPFSFLLPQYFFLPCEGHSAREL